MSNALGHYDILITGGGPVGASLARALAGTPWRIGLIEAVAVQNTRIDERILALSWGSRVILEALGVWTALASQATPIERIHISDRGQIGLAHLDCREYAVPALGYVVPIRVLGQALHDRLAGQPRLDMLCPARLTGLEAGAGTMAVTLATPTGPLSLTTRLLVAADGGRSVIREQLGIPTQVTDYHQSAIITTLTTALPHRGRAFERFTDQGPLAFLPLSGHRCSVVWTVPGANAETLLNLSGDAFLTALQDRFGFRLGRLLPNAEQGQRHAYPLRLARVLRDTGPRAVLIGNAAHHLHPVAGQGLNLGLRDVALLADLLTDAAHTGDDPGNPLLLTRYSDGRREDQANTVLWTDSLVRLFTQPFAPVRWARTLGLLALDGCGPLKTQVARRFMGLSGPLPRLARGIPLE